MYHFQRFTHNLLFILLYFWSKNIMCHSSHTANSMSVVQMFSSFSPNYALHNSQQVTTLYVLHPSSSGIQACYNDPVMLCDRPGRALAVCVNPDQSLPLLDGQRHQHAQRSQGVLQDWCGEQAGQHRKWTTFIQPSNTINSMKNKWYCGFNLVFVSEVSLPPLKYFLIFL